MRVRSTWWSVTLIAAVAVASSAASSPKAAKPAPSPGGNSGSGGSGMSDQTVAALHAAQDSLVLGPYVARFADLRKLLSVGDFAGAAKLAHDCGAAAGDAAVNPKEVAARAVVVAMFRGYEGEATALNGDVVEAKRILSSVERLDVGNDLKALAAVAQGYADMTILDLDSATRNEYRAIGLARRTVAPVLAAAAEVWQGDPSRALRELQALVGVGATGSQAKLYAGCAALAADEPNQAHVWLGKAQADLGYQPLWYLASGLTAAAHGNLDEAAKLLAEGAEREKGDLRRCAFVAAVVSSARGQSADLSPYVNSVPPNYQRIAADLGAAPSQEAAEQALRHPSWWWSQNAYGGELAALAARAEPQPAAAAAGGSGGGGGESAGAGGGGGAAPAPNGSPASGATPASGAAPASGENATAPSDVDVRVDAAQAFNAYQNALRNLAAGRTAEAERGLRSAVELYHAFAEGWLALGHVQAERGAWAEAGRAYNHAATLRPDWPEAWFGMARAADAAPRPAEALTDYQRSLAAGLKGEAASFARERVAALGGK